PRRGVGELEVTLVKGDAARLDAHGGQADDVHSREAHRAEALRIHALQPYLLHGRGAVYRLDAVHFPAVLKVVLDPAEAELVDQVRGEHVRVRHNDGEVVALSGPDRPVKVS